MYDDMLNQVYGGNSVCEYLYVIGIIVLGSIIIKLFQIIILSRVKKMAEKTKTSLDDFAIKVIKKNILPLVYYGMFYFSLKTININDEINHFVRIIGAALVTICIARFFTTLFDYGFRTYLRRRNKTEIMERSMSGIVRVGMLIIWAISISVFLDNMGFKISAIVAGLGIGGVAVALAAQAVLGDLFSYVSILLDRPFEIGDFIIIGEYMGTVDHIGIKTTRVNSLGGEQLIFSNTDLTNSRVRNYKRMKQRRVVFKIGVTYDTTQENIFIIPKLIQSIIESIEDTRFDRAHFQAFGDFSLLFEVVYYVNGSDYNMYMDIQEKINLGIRKEFSSKGIEFAYPTQTLYVTKNN